MISSAPFPLFDASRLRRLQKKKKKKESLQSRPVHSEISDTNRFSKCTNHTEELSPSSSSAGGGELREQPDISCSVQFHGCSRSHWLGF